MWSGKHPLLGQKAIFHQPCRRGVDLRQSRTSRTDQKRFSVENLIKWLTSASCAEDHSLVHQFPLAFQMFGENVIRQSQARTASFETAHLEFPPLPPVGFLTRGILSGKMVINIFPPLLTRMPGYKVCESQSGQLSGYFPFL